MTKPLERYTAFEGGRRIATGPPAEVALAARGAIERGPAEPVLVFDDATGRVVDLDLRADEELMLARLKQDVAIRREGADAASRGPGRPRLGVVSREVTLLPRHWAWLGAQRGGASATLRRLVDRARKANEGRDRVRAAQDATYRFLNAVGGDRPGYEEAIRALYHRDGARFEEELDAWPPDLRAYALALAGAALAVETSQQRGGAGPHEG